MDLVAGSVGGRRPGHFCDLLETCHDRMQYHVYLRGLAAL
jgi:hypothetical protein